MEVYVMWEVGDTVTKDGKEYLVVGTAGINSYLVVDKAADPKELADVKFLQVSWVGNSKQ